MAWFILLAWLLPGSWYIHQMLRYTDERDTTTLKHSIILLIIGPLLVVPEWLVGHALEADEN